MADAFSALGYLRAQLGLSGPEWQGLSNEDKLTLKKWAYEENGLEIPAGLS